MVVRVRALAAKTDVYGRSVTEALRGPGGCGAFYTRRGGGGGAPRVAMDTGAYGGDAPGPLGGLGGRPKRRLRNCSVVRKILRLCLNFFFWC